jgi:hypothetical protein
MKKSTAEASAADADGHADGNAGAVLDDNADGDAVMDDDDDADADTRGAFAARSRRWRALGFQSDNPLSDIRGGGELGLELLVRFAERRGGAEARAMLAQRGGAARRARGAARRDEGDTRGQLSCCSSAKGV